MPQGADNLAEQKWKPAGCYYLGPLALAVVEAMYAGDAEVECAQEVTEFPADEASYLYLDPEP